MCEVALGDIRANETRRDFDIAGVYRSGLTENLERLVGTTTLIEFFGDRLELGDRSGHLADFGRRPGPDQPRVQIARIDGPESHADLRSAPPITFCGPPIRDTGESGLGIDEQALLHGDLRQLKQ